MRSVAWASPITRWPNSICRIRCRILRSSQGHRPVSMQRSVNVSSIRSCRQNGPSAAPRPILGSVRCTPATPPPLLRANFALPIPLRVSFASVLQFPPIPERRNPLRSRQIILSISSHCLRVTPQATPQPRAQGEGQGSPARHARRRLRSQAERVQYNFPRAAPRAHTYLQT